MVITNCPLPVAAMRDEILRLIEKLHAFNMLPSPRVEQTDKQDLSLRAYCKS